MVQDERNIGLGAAAERSPSASIIRTSAGDQASPIGWLQPVEPRREDGVCLMEGHDGLAALEVTDAETLADLRLPPARFCVDSLLPQGLTILGGAPKVGKSWLTLDLCLRVAKGEPLWGLATSKGTTLCLCLEDTLSRVQQRLLCITDDAPGNAFFATAADLLADGLCDQIRRFVAEHPDTVLVVIDTFHYAIANGDKNVYYIDGASMFRGPFEDCCTVDGTHPNDLGFAKMAEAVYAVLHRALRDETFLKN